MSNPQPQIVDEPEPRWPAFISVLAVAGLYAALPSYLTMGPRWLFLALVVVLLIPTIISHWIGHQKINRIFGFLVIIVVTIGMIFSVVLLINALPGRRETPRDLLLSAASLWVTNVLVFALWYWKIDAGGPHRRDRRIGHPDGAFLFPQMTMSNFQKQHWSPNFVDYLFLSFNTSTAFSPTDAPVLERWAKLMMMVQSFISLTVVALLAARAVNVL